MANSTIAQAFQTTRKTNKILFKAGTHIVKTSFDTTKSIANLYKNAGVKAFGFGKNLLKETIKLAFDNQKDVRDTSVKALKEAVEVIRERKKAAAKKTVQADVEIPVKKGGKKKKQAEITIDDLLKD